MAGSTYFVQECPTCGRRLFIRVEYLGKKVVCQHCSAPFVATDPSSNRYPGDETVETLLRRAEARLRADSRLTASSRTPNPR